MERYLSLAVLSSLKTDTKFLGGDFNSAATDRAVANNALANIEVFDTQTNSFVTSAVFSGGYVNTMPQYHFKGSHAVVDDRVIFIGGTNHN